MGNRVGVNKGAGALIFGLDAGDVSRPRGQMRPDEFVAAIAEWIAGDAAALERIPHDHIVETVDEARAICSALRQGSVNRDCLHTLLLFFQAVEIVDVAIVLRDEGLPLLRRILTDALSRPEDAGTDELSVFDKKHICLVLLKILALYQQRGDGALITAAARVPALADEVLWSVVFGILGERHPDAMEVCDALREPLPDGFVGIAYLDFANGLAANDRISHHPFNSESGIERVKRYLTDENPDFKLCDFSRGMPALPQEWRTRRVDEYR